VEELVWYLGIDKSIPANLFYTLLTLITLTLMRLVELNIIWIIASIFLVAIAIKGGMSYLMFSLIM